SPGVDDTPPPPVITVTPQLTNARSPMLTGTITDSTAAIQVTVDGNVYTADNNGDGTWTLAANTISPPLSTGVYEIAVVAASLFGVGTDDSALELTLDTDAASVAVNSLATRDSTPGLSGTVSDPLAEVRITLGGNTYLATNNGDGSWTLADDVLSPALSVGLHNVCIIVRDPAGNLGADLTTDELNILPPNPLLVVSVGLNSDQIDPADLARGPQPTDWQSQRSEFKSIVVTFNENVTMDINDIRLINLGVNAPVDNDSVISLTPDLLTVVDNVATISFLDPRIVTDGVYRLEVLPSATDDFGFALDGDNDGTAGGIFAYQGNASNAFYKLEAEWSGDAGVSVFDFSTFSYWFGTAVPTAPDYADINRDNGISVFDFSAFSNNFGIGITYPNAFQSTFVAIFAEELPGEAGDALASPEAEMRIDRIVAIDWSAPIQRASEVEQIERVEEQVGLDELLDDIAGDVAAIWNR
ncbi:MAG: hypothetical protein ACI9G1_002381, partial [Pirellulaceae bacterium]